MLTGEMNLALNRQLNAEYESFWLYYSMAAWTAKEDFPGMTKWLLCQAAEERDHGQRIFDYLIARDGTVELSSLSAPVHSWESVTKLFENALANEQKVTASIHALIEEAHAKNDIGTVIFLHWFVTEQIEEEAQVLAILRMLERGGDCAASLLYIDSQLGKRRE